ncbi:hypothetical protein [Burkholderia sp. MSMB1589WGS]|uniref:hypothetical protein n=1 Tax=Burkholderia sp. MSMB1589WGS TaxID=1636425 RepID=UPI0007B9C500|nr:hypothetical protein [Burkholderia sp. MSMB1589WGS]
MRRNARGLDARQTGVQRMCVRSEGRMRHGSGVVSVEYAKAMPQQRKKICNATLNASSQDELLRMRDSMSTNERT